MLITSKENPNIKTLTKLLSGKKYRNEMGVFVVEGMRNCVDVVKQANEKKTEIVWAFYTEESLENYKKSLDVTCISKLDENKKFCITKEIADKISLEDNNQGIFVVAKKLDLEFSKENLDEKGKYVVLNHLQDPGNVGTLLRTADAVGADGVVLTGNCCDLYNPKVVRSAMGSMGRIKIYVEDDFSRVCNTLSELGIKTLAAVIKNGVSVTEYDFDKPCAVVIGNEGNGLSESDADMCDEKITIRMNGNIDSLNAAVAGAIILWEMFR
ncbi:MAG: RNA methyltransferase [Ruminococcus sp.]|nr:RNA methyltransferase [Ruminococcus sp.]